MFVIVQNARSDVWLDYFSTDPKLGVTADHSAHQTVMGKYAGLKPLYIERYEAMEALRRIRILNSSGNYAICPVIEKET